VASQQATLDELRAMTAQEFELARDAGKLDAIFRGESPLPTVTLEDLKSMTPEARVQARRDGRLRHLGIAP
jgi:hypothetical protein